MTESKQIPLAQEQAVQELSEERSQFLDAPNAIPKPKTTFLSKLLLKKHQFFIIVFGLFLLTTVGVAAYLSYEEKNEIEPENNFPKQQVENIATASSKPNKNLSLNEIYNNLCNLAKKSDGECSEQSNIPFFYIANWKNASYKENYCFTSGLYQNNNFPTISFLTDDIKNYLESLILEAGFFIDDQREAGAIKEVASLTFLKKDQSEIIIVDPKNDKIDEQGATGIEIVFFNDIEELEKRQKNMADIVFDLSWRGIGGPLANHKKEPCTIDSGWTLGSTTEWRRVKVKNENEWTYYLTTFISGLEATTRIVPLYFRENNITGETQRIFYFEEIMPSPNLDSLESSKEINCGVLLENNVTEMERDKILEILHNEFSSLVPANWAEWNKEGDTMYDKMRDCDLDKK